MRASSALFYAASFTPVRRLRRDARRGDNVRVFNGDHVRTSRAGPFHTCAASDEAGETAPDAHPPCSLEVSIPLSNLYDRAVKRAFEDPFIPWENSAGIVNLAECGSTNGGGMGDSAAAPDMTPTELVDTTLGELRDLFGTGGVVAEAALTFSAAAAMSVADGEKELGNKGGGDGGGGSEGETTGLGNRAGGDSGDEETRGGATGAARDLARRASWNGSGGFVWTSLGQFMDTPDWEGEAELWESMLETYALLLAPGALRGATEPGWFLICVAGRDEEVLLTGLDRLRTQLLQRKFLHGRW